MAADKSPKSASKSIKKNVGKGGKYPRFVKLSAQECKATGKKFDATEIASTWKSLEDGAEYTFSF